MGEHKTIMGKDLYWMNFFGLMLLTLIEVAAVGLDLSPEATGLNYTEKELTLFILVGICLLYTSPSPRDRTRSRMPSSA